MVNKELLDYLKSVIDQGYNREKIKQHLLNYNYPEDVIEAAFLELGSLNQKQDVPKSPVVVQDEKVRKKDQDKKAKPITIIIIILFILFAGGAAYYFLFYDFSSGCEDIFIEKFSNEGVSWICVYPDNSKLHFLLKNTGNSTINVFDFDLKGTKGSYSERLEGTEVDGGEIFTRSVDISSENRDYGDVNTITITPGYEKEGRVKMCRSKKLIYQEDINSC